MAGSSESQRPLPDTQVSEQAWGQLHHVIHDSDDALQILEVKIGPDKRVHRRDIDMAFQRRLEALKALGRGHEEEVKSDAKKCLAAKQALLSGKTKLSGNGNGHPERQKGNGKLRVAETIDETRHAAAKTAPETVEEKGPQAPAGIMERTKGKKGVILGVAGAASAAAATVVGWVAFSGKPKTDEPVATAVNPPAAKVQILPADAPELKQAPLPPPPPAFEPTKMETTEATEPKPEGRPAVEKKAPLVTEEKPATEPAPAPTPEPAPAMIAAKKTAEKSAEVAVNTAQGTRISPPTKTKVENSQKLDLVDAGYIFKQWDAEFPSLEKIDQMTQEIRTEPSSRNNKDNSAIARKSLGVMQMLCFHGEHMRALEFSRSIQAKIDRTNARLLLDGGRAIAREKKIFADIQPHLETLQQNPNDAEANRAAGIFFGCVQGNWPRALPHLAKSPLRDLAIRTAQREQLSAEQLLELGRSWEEYAAIPDNRGAATMVVSSYANAERKSPPANRELSDKTFEAHQAALRSLGKHLGPFASIDLSPQDLAQVKKIDAMPLIFSMSEEAFRSLAVGRVERREMQIGGITKKVIILSPGSQLYFREFSPSQRYAYRFMGIVSRPEDKTAFPRKEPGGIFVNSPLVGNTSLTSMFGMWGKAGGYSVEGLSLSNKGNRSRCATPMEMDVPAFFRVETEVGTNGFGKAIMLSARGSGPFQEITRYENALSAFNSHAAIPAKERRFLVFLVEENPWIIADFAVYFTQPKT